MTQLTIRRAISAASVLITLLVALLTTGCSAFRSPLITGQNYLAQGDSERALLAFDKAIERGIDLPFAYANRCIANDALLLHNEAVGDCTKSLELTEESSPEGYNRYEVLNNRAVAYINLRRRDEARADLDAALELKPDYAEAIANIGRLYIDDGDYVTAIEKLDEALAINDQLSQAFGNRGFAHQNRGDNVKAMADFDRAIAIDNNIDAWQNRAMLNYSLGRFNAAYEDFQTIQRIADHGSSAYYMADSQVKLLESRPTDRADDDLSDYTPEAPDAYDEPAVTDVLTDTALLTDTLAVTDTATIEAP